MVMMPYRIKSPFTHTRIGRRGACLMIFGFIPFAVGGALFVQPTGVAGQSRGIPVLVHIAPAPVWSIVWMVLGVTAVTCAFSTWRYIRFGYVLAFLLPLVWGASYLISWMLGELVTGWISAVIYLGYSLLVMIISGWEEVARPLETVELPPEGTPDA
jgi:hypothetical protein